MDKYDYLKLMIEHRDVWNDDTVEIYFDAHEEYFNIVDYEEEHKIPDKKEIKMLIDSLYNIDIYSYLRDTLVDRIGKFMDVSDENFEYALKCMLENFDGYYVMMRLFYFLDFENIEYKKKIVSALEDISLDRKFYMKKWLDYDRTTFSDEFMDIVCNEEPIYVTKFYKKKYDCVFLPHNIKLSLSGRDVFVLSIVQGYRFYLDERTYMHLLWDEKREELNRELNIKDINLIAEIKDYYLIEKDGFYYIRHRDKLNEDVYDVTVGNSLEKVLENVNLFSWIK